MTPMHRDQLPAFLAAMNDPEGKAMSPAKSRSIIGTVLSLEPLREEVARRLDVPLDQLVVTVDTRESKPLMTIEIHRCQALETKR